MDAFLMIFGVSPENAKVRFDCAGASGLRFSPMIFWLCASIFALGFLHCFFQGFWTSQGTPKYPKISSSASEAGPP